jgi:ATP-dependent protease ClpP protease subunit
VTGVTRGFTNGPPPTRVANLDRRWYNIRNANNGEAEIMIYDEIGFWGTPAETFVAELKALNVSSILLHLNSPGGDVFDGIAIMEALRSHPAKVTVHVDALAASIASVIAQAGDRVIVGRYSQMMIHNASGWASGDYREMEKTAELLKAINATIADVYTDRAGGKQMDWLAAMEEETWYDAQSAVKAGLADEVAQLDTEAQAHKAVAKWNLRAFAKRPPETIPAPPEDEPGQTATVIDFSALKPAITRAVRDPEPPKWDPDILRGAVASIAQNAPAPPPPPVKPAPLPGFNPLQIADAIREARR